MWCERIRGFGRPLLSISSSHGLPHQPVESYHTLTPPAASLSRLGVTPSRSMLWYPMSFQPMSSIKMKNTFGLLWLWLAPGSIILSPFSSPPTLAFPITHLTGGGGGMDAISTGSSFGAIRNNLTESSRQKQISAGCCESSREGRREDERDRNGKTDRG